MARTIKYVKEYDRNVPQNPVTIRSHTSFKDWSAGTGAEPFYSLDIGHPDFTATLTLAELRKLRDVIDTALEQGPIEAAKEETRYQGYIAKRTEEVK